MPRTAIVSQVVNRYPANGVVTPAALDVAFTAADVANGNSFQSSGRDLLLVKNTDVSSHTFTLGSVPDANGRLGNVGPYTVGAGLDSQFLVDQQALYSFTDGVHLDASDIHILFAVLKV